MANTIFAESKVTTYLGRASHDKRMGLACGPHDSMRQPHVARPHKVCQGLDLGLSAKGFSLFVRLVADGWCWFVLREKYCWLVGDG
jgi:hypothetical protein